MKISTCTMAFLFAAASVAACGGAEIREAPEREREVFEPEAGEPRGDEAAAAPAQPVPADSLAAAANGFAIALWSELHEEQPANLVVSPASVHLALSMALAGAGGDTAEQLAAVLGAGDEHAAYHAAVGEQLARWNDPERESYELAVANRLFAEQSYTWREPFLELLAQTYGAPLDEQDFRAAPEPARHHINEWVEAATRGRIKNLLPEGSIHGQTRMVLTNAVYFFGDWLDAFDPARTRDRTFYAPAGERDVPMMHRRGRFAYAEAEGVQLLEMPYRGEELAMVVALPRERDGLPAIEAALDARALADALEGLRRREVNLVLPRFEIDPPEPLSLASALRRLGVTDAFTPHEADFSSMADPAENEGLPLFLDEVFHKAFVSVDEEGTEAAAATGAVIGVTSAPAEPPERIDFIADRPFLFLIRDRQTGLILFMGRLTDPGA
jgi:serpin B